MSNDPSTAILKAVRAAIISSANATALIGNRVYSNVPKQPTYPFVYIGDDRIAPDFDAGEFYDCTVTLHAFNREPGQTLLRQVVAEVVAATNRKITVEGFANSHEVAFPEVQYRVDPDQTKHAIITLTYCIQALTPSF